MKFLSGFYSVFRGDDEVHFGISKSDSERAFDLVEPSKPCVFSMFSLEFLVKAEVQQLKDQIKQLEQNIKQEAFSGICGSWR